MTRRSMQSIFIFVALLVLVLAAASSQAGGGEQCQAKNQPVPPFVTPKLWLPESVINLAEIPMKDVYSYSQVVEANNDDNAEECDSSNNNIGNLQQVTVGQMPQFSTEQSLAVLQAAQDAWQGGAGVWTSQMTLQQRVDAIQKFFVFLKQSREEIVTALQWEIGKNRPDAEAEFDRTIAFGQQLIDIVTTDPEFVGQWQQIVSGKNKVTSALVKRAAIGIVLALAPYNYPINESYATILPALLLGNIVILKIPTVGGLAHLLTMDAWNKALPAGVVNFIAGSGRATMPPLMATGKIDSLAFIGGSHAADALIHAHPHPHRLHVFLQLEAKNMGIVLADVFDIDNSKVLENAANQAILGALSYNGQRCTALKLFFAPHTQATTFVDKLVERVSAVTVGLSWQTHGNNSKIYSQITPLPNHGRVRYMQELLDDAVSKGAKIMNEGGGSLIGGENSTLMRPAVVYPVTPDMRLYTEEQFGPLVPVATYENLETVLKYGQEGQYAQQVSIFTSFDKNQAARLIDAFGAVFGKINLNQQCGRSPDTVPFAGRRSSAMGVMSVRDALLEFSVPTVLAHSNQDLNAALVQGLEQQSAFLQTPTATQEQIE